MTKQSEQIKGKEVFGKTGVLPMRDRFFPPMKDLISLGDIEKETGIPKRKFRYYMAHDVISKTIRIGQDGYYRRDYIFLALDCISMFEGVFKLPLATFTRIMKVNGGSLQKLSDLIQAVLNKYPPGNQIPFYPLFEKKLVDHLLAGELDIDLSTMEKSAVKEFGTR